MTGPTTLEAMQAANDRWGELKTLCASVEDPAEAARLIETWAATNYPKMEHREAVATLLAEAPILQALYERGRRMVLDGLGQEQEAQRADLARVLNPEGDMAKMEKLAMWDPDKIEAENRAYGLYRKSVYANSESIGRRLRVEKNASDFDTALMSCATVAAEVDGVPVHEAVARILKSSRALDIARVAAARGARVPGAHAVLNRAYRAAAVAQPGRAVAAACKAVERFDPGPPPED
jgi:hypothetical protein